MSPTHKPVKVDRELMEFLFKAQLVWTRETISHTTDEGYYTDSQYDYLGAALDLSGKLNDIYYENNEAELDRLLNTPNELLHNYAVDGICPQMMNLANNTEE